MSRTLLVGLGNPGAQYSKTRHNIGFMVLDRLAQRHNLPIQGSKFKGLWGSGAIGTASVVMLKPQTFMNLSGDSVQPASTFFGVAHESIVVVHDELDLELGKVRLKSGGGINGHNGLRDMVAKLQSKDFARVRMGIGRPLRGDVTGWVLGPFRPDEEPLRDEMIDVACDALELILYEGIIAAQNRFNAP